MLLRSVPFVTQRWHLSALCVPVDIERAAVLPRLLTSGKLPSVRMELLPLVLV
jgi:hypothetical protein